MARPPVQISLDDLGTPLHRCTFVVVDLETTGGSPTDCRITEIGAVKIAGGELRGELSTLVDPGVAIPASIAALTGITDSTVAGWPPVEAVLPTFLEFARDCVLVAHNARFDIGFLDANLGRLDYPRLPNPVVCTAALARRLVRDEVRDCRLATLAAHFRTRTVPVHRALADARATVEVFHSLLERAGSFGVTTLEDLIGFAKVRNTPLFRARRGLADGLPHAPGVYAFRSASGEVLYVGKATDLRTRVRSYFGSDDRRKIVDLLKETARVDHLVCATPVEAAVRELRGIHTHRPRFNRRSKTPERGVWLSLTAERHPRLSIVRTPRPEATACLGPLGSKRAAQQVADALLDLAPLRRCTDRLGPRSALDGCALGEMGRCAAPCLPSGGGRVAHAAAVEAVAAAMRGEVAEAIARADARMRRLAASERFEEAADARDRLRALVAAAARTRRLQALRATAELVVSRPGRSAGHREVVLARAGRLVASRVAEPGRLEPTVGELLAANPPRLDDGEAPLTPGLAAELELLAAWLEGRGAVVHRCDGAYAEPHAGGRDLAEQARRLAAPGRATGRPAAELAAKRTRRPTGPGGAQPAAPAGRRDRAVPVAAAAGTLRP